MWWITGCGWNPIRVMRITSFSSAWRTTSFWVSFWDNSAALVYKETRRCEFRPRSEKRVLVETNKNPNESALLLSLFYSYINLCIFGCHVSSNVSAEQRDIIEAGSVVVSVVLVVLKDAIPSSTQEDGCFCGGNEQ
jgi:hypothetical protein